MRRFLLSVLLIFPLLTLLFGLFVIDADVTIRGGNSCIPNNADCPTGYTNLGDAIGSGIQLRGLTRSNLLNSINTTPGFEGKPLADMCVSEGVGSIIEVLVGNRERNTQGDRYLKEYNFRLDAGGDIYSIPKGCPSGWNAQRAPKGFPVAGWNPPYGCCPSGYRFVANTTQSSPLAVQGGICCKNGRGNEAATYWRSEGSPLGCAYDATGNAAEDTAPWSGLAPQPFNGSLENLNAAIASGNGPESIISVTSGDVLFPTLGVPLGPGGGTFGMRVGQRSGAPFVCPANSQCATTSNDSLAIVNPESFLTDPNATCTRCFTQGDTIGIDTTAETVRFCTGPGQFRDEELIGTPDITEGFLITDEANKEFYRQCFESGGIYTALGCIDPTPTGIITGLIRIALGVMGGVALLQLIYVGVLYQQGQKDKIQSARNQLIATITGIAVLVFSVLILRIIGVNILDIIPSGSV